MKPALLLFILFSTLIVFSQEQTQNRRFQHEFSGGYLPVIGPVFHVQGGLNFPGKKTNWFTNFSLDLDRQGNFTHNYFDYYAFTVGKHYQWKLNHFYGSLGFNAGLFVSYPSFDKNYYRWINSGICLTPRGEIGWNGDKIIVCSGLYISMGGGYYHHPELFELYDYKKSPWFYKFSGVLCPYVKVILK